METLVHSDFDCQFNKCYIKIINIADVTIGEENDEVVMICCC